MIVYKNFKSKFKMNKFDVYFGKDRRINIIKFYMINYVAYNLVIIYNYIKINKQNINIPICWGWRNNFFLKCDK